MSRRPENQNGRSFPGALSQFLTSGETAGAEAPPRADEAVNNDSRPVFLSRPGTRTSRIMLDSQDSCSPLFLWLDSLTPN
jgi:hypothetical protein